jgi:hypothetical protein
MVISEGVSRRRSPGFPEQVTRMRNGFDEFRSVRHEVESREKARNVKGDTGQLHFPLALLR